MKTRIVALALAVLAVAASFFARNALADVKTVNTALRMALTWLERAERLPKASLKTPARQSLARGGGKVRASTGSAQVQEQRALDVSSPVVALSESLGELWLGTFDEGLFRSSREGASRVEVDARVNDVAVGNEGSVFVATNGGAYRVDRDGARKLGDGVFTSAAVWKGEGYFSSKRGVSRVTPSGLWTRGPAQGLAADSPGTLEDCGETLCVGALDGLWLYDGVRAERRSSADDTLPSDWVTAIAHSGGTTWAGTFDAGLARMEKGRARRLSTEDGLPEARIQPHGLVLVGETVAAATPNGLLLADAKGVTLITEGLPTREITSIAPARDGGVWIGYRGGASRVTWSVTP